MCIYIYTAQDGRRQDNKPISYLLLEVVRMQSSYSWQEINTPENHNSEIPLESATGNPLEFSSENPLEK